MCFVDSQTYRIRIHSSYLCVSSLTPHIECAWICVNSVDSSGGQDCAYACTFETALTVNLSPNHHVCTFGHYCAVASIAVEHDCVQHQQLGHWTGHWFRCPVRLNQKMSLLFCLIHIRVRIFWKC